MTEYRNFINFGENLTMRANENRLRLPNFGSFGIIFRKTHGYDHKFTVKQHYFIVSEVQKTLSKINPIFIKTVCRDESNISSRCGTFVLRLSFPIELDYNELRLSFSNE